MKKILLVLAIVLSGFIWRTLSLADIPTALHPDEQTYTANALSFVYSGTGLNNEWTPWKLMPLTPMHAEWPALITSFGFIFTDNPLVATRIPSVIMGGLLPIILAWIGWGLFKNEQISLGILLTTTFNPWILQNSRFGFDPLYSLFFYALAIAIFLNIKSSKKYLSIPLMMIGFFQYQGYKLLFLPIIFLLVLKDWQDIEFKFKKKFVIKNVLILGISSLFFLGYIISLKSSSATFRVSDRSLLSSGYVGDISIGVDVQRRVSVSNKVTPFLINKYNNIIIERVDNVFNALSPSNLFLHGDPALSGFSVWSQGFFYIIEALFILISIGWIFRKKNIQKSWLLLAFLAIGLLPVTMNTSNRWFIFRTSFTYVSLMIISGIGLGQILKKKNWIINTIIFGILLLSIGNYSYHYFVRFPVYTTQGNYFDHRQLASYVTRASKNKTVNIYSPEAESLFLSYLVYSNQINSDSIESIKHNYAMGKFSIGNANFLHECVPTYFLNDKNITYVVDPYEEECKYDIPETDLLIMPLHVSLANILDSGEIYKVYGDPVCDAEKLSIFLGQRDLKSFKLEKLDDETFCSKWVTNVTKLNSK